MKVELLIGKPLQNLENRREAIFEYIEVDYNRQRRHCAIGYQNPEQFEGMFVSYNNVHFWWWGSDQYIVSS
jgi:transposase InsO family protein